MTDGDHNPPKRVPEGIPHLTAKNIKNGQLQFAGCTFITDESFEKAKRRYEPRADDVIVTCVGTLGETAVVPDGIVFSADRNLAVIRLIPSGLLPQTAFFQLNGPRMQRLIQDASGSTAQPHLYLGDLRRLAVPLLPIEEQQELCRRLVEQLERIAEIEAEVAESESALTQLDQSILAKAFRGELVPQDPRDEPASELLARIRTTRETDAAKPTKKAARRKRKDVADA